MFKKIDKDDFYKLVEKMKTIQDAFYKKFGVDDIWSNSKIYEIVVANTLGHILIPGHSGSRDACDKDKNLFEYKHYKQSSSNHTWTFNDFTDTTIEKLKSVKSVIFAHIDDSGERYPGTFDWYYEVPGTVMSKYLRENTTNIRNKRKMINISSAQIEAHTGSKRIRVSDSKDLYKEYLEPIYSITIEIEKISGTKNTLTSNKFWELLVAVCIGHNINSEQGGRKGAFDGFDKEGNTYEYKVSKVKAWTFQDISENVLEKYKDDKGIILAVVDKQKIKVRRVYIVDPINLLPLLVKKLCSKYEKAERENTTIRRTNVIFTPRDLATAKAEQVVPRK